VKKSFLKSKSLALKPSISSWTEFWSCHVTQMGWFCHKEQSKACFDNKKKEIFPSWTICFGNKDSSQSNSDHLTTATNKDYMIFFHPEKVKGHIEKKKIKMGRKNFWNIFWPPPINHQNCCTFLLEGLFFLRAYECDVWLIKRSKEQHVEKWQKKSQTILIKKFYSITKCTFFVIDSTWPLEKFFFFLSSCWFD